MLQAFATLLFAAVAVFAALLIGTMLTCNRSAIVRALGIRRSVDTGARLLPPRYRTLAARRATIMTVRESVRRVAA